MENATFYKYLQEVRQQCRFGQAAFDLARKSLLAMDSDRTFLYVHALLNHCLAASRLFWPERADSEGRGSRLRGELNVTEASPLRLRGLRARLERSDEQFTDWLGTLEEGSFVEMNIMPQGTLGGFKSDVFHRSLDPDKLTFVFRGDSWDLRELVQELRRVDKAAESWMRANKPW